MQGAPVQRGDAPPPFARDALTEAPRTPDAGAHRERHAPLLLVLAGLLSLVLAALLLAPGEGSQPLVTSPTVPPAGEAPAVVTAGALDRPECEVSAILVPSCGRWWGVAPGALTKVPRDEALRAFEDKAGRPMDVYHSYHVDDELFPTQQEIGFARDPDGRRLLFLNWKPSTSATWAEVAEGAADARIDALATHIADTFPERFFLTIWHEPENDVDESDGSGMTADDYANMYRHVITRLRDRGVDNAVTVMTYMGSPTWGVAPWFDSLYPGDDVVDWIGYDPYIFATPKGAIRGSFADLANRRGNGWTGFYDWAQAEHPGKPLVIAEWGVFTSATEPGRKAWVFDTVQADIAEFPAIKALVYFESPNAPKGDTRIDSSPDAAEAFMQLGRQREFIAPAVPE